MIQSNTEFKTILVPLDGSAHAEHALPHAISIARRNGATIRLALVHAPISPSDDPWNMYHRDFLVDIDEDRVREKQDYLNSVVRRIKQRDSIRVVTVLAEGDRTADELCSAAQGADLVVMATHGRGRLAKLWHGSTADALLRRVDCPLLLVRGYPAPADLTGDPLPGKVLAPLDGSLFSEQILPATAEIARISNADVRLLHVDRFPVVEGMTSDPGSYLRSASTSVVAKAPYVDFEIAETYESPATAVLASARDQRADLIALTTRARPSLSRWVRASVLDAVLQRSAVPVLVMRGEEALRTKKRTATSATAV